MTFYQDVQNVASEVLREFKQGEIKYIKVTPGKGPKHAPGAPTETVYDVDAAARGVQFKYIDGTQIVASDMQIVMAVRPDVTPDMKGFVSVDGVRYKIKACMAVPPAGTPVAHKIVFGK